MQQDYERCENKMHAFLMKIVVKNTYIPVSRKFQYEKKNQVGTMLLYLKKVISSDLPTQKYIKMNGYQ